MRNIKELLTVMLENQELFDRSLCYWINELQYKKYITPEECRVLKIYIRENVPWWVEWFSLGYHRTGFYWLQGNIKPRIRWIKKHIKKND